jgi:hypothetical protein
MKGGNDLPYHRRKPFTHQLLSTFLTRWKSHNRERSGSGQCGFSESLHLPGPRGVPFHPHGEAAFVPIVQITRLTPRENMACYSRPNFSSLPNSCCFQPRASAMMPPLRLWLFLPLTPCIFHTTHFPP